MRALRRSQVVPLAKDVTVVSIKKLRTDSSPDLCFWENGADALALFLPLSTAENLGQKTLQGEEKADSLRSSGIGRTAEQSHP